MTQIKIEVESGNGNITAQVDDERIGRSVSMQEKDVVRILLADAVAMVRAAFKLDED